MKNRVARDFNLLATNQHLLGVNISLTKFASTILSFGGD
jgi:hypothetical protein